MGPIHGVHIDANKCLCHELCVSLCPAVFELDPSNAVARVKDGVNFNEHATQIMDAIRACPVYAIWAEVDRS